MDCCDYIEAYNTHGSMQKAATALGIPKTTFRDRYIRQKSEDQLRHLALKYSDTREIIPDGQLIKSTSILYDADGNKKLTWIKTDQERQEKESRYEAILEALQDDIVHAPITPRPADSNESLCSVYIISDFHLGQYSSFNETGADWTLESAVATIKGWIDSAIQSTPNAKQAILCDLGDFLHTDGLLPITPASGHVLDAGARFRDTARVAIELFDYAIQRLLSKHDGLRVIIAEGNHNMDSSYWMTLAVSRRYENDPRIEFDFSQIPYYAFKWGQTSLFFHHGHKKKMGEISRSLAAQFRDIYGTTKYSYAHVGHLHHRELKEDSLMVVEQHSTMAAKDAYSARGGYHSERGASVITYHDKHGEVGRVSIRPEMCHIF